MDTAFILDDNFQIMGVVDTFESFIWTERYSSPGDFEMTLKSNSTVRSLLKDDRYVMIPESEYLMLIQTGNGKEGQEDGQLLTVQGKSACSMLDRRLTPIYPGTDLWGASERPPGAWAAFLIMQAMGDLSAYESLPIGGYVNDISGGSDMDYMPTPGNLRSEVESILQAFDLGYRFKRLADGNFECIIYKGADRYSTVVFSTSMDNLSNVEHLWSSETYANVAYVFTESARRTVVASGVSSSISGKDRRSIIVDATDIKESDATRRNKLMDSRGRQALRAQRKVVSLDGDVSQKTGYVYGTHFRLGDEVQFRNTYGVKDRVRVTEYIRTYSVSEGQKAYPTFEEVE